MDEKKHKVNHPIPARVHPDALEAIGAGPRDETAIEVAAPDPQELASGVVAHGKTVHIVVPGKVPCGFDVHTARTIFRQNFREAREGETITLERAEIDRLRTQGFLVDPNKVLPADAVTFDAQAFHKATPTPGRVTNGQGQR